MVFHRSMLDWRRGWGQSPIGICALCYIYIYIYIYIYMKLIWCNGFAEIYTRSVIRCAKCGVAVLEASMLNWGVSVCHGYMCIVLYMKLIWSNDFAEIYASIAGGVGVNLP